MAFTSSAFRSLIHIFVGGYFGIIIFLGTNSFKLGFTSNTKGEIAQSKVNVILMQLFSKLGLGKSAGESSFINQKIKLKYIKKLNKYKVINYK